MILDFNIPNAKATRLGDAMPKYGYVFDPQLGTTDAQQKIAFVKKKTIEYWREMTNNAEVEVAAKAAAATVVTDFSDIT